MNRQADLTVKAETAVFNDTLFLAMELSRATWLVATFAPRLGDKISVHAIPGGDTKRLLDLIGRLQAKLRGKGSPEFKKWRRRPAGGASGICGGGRRALGWRRIVQRQCAEFLKCFYGAMALTYYATTSERCMTAPVPPSRKKSGRLMTSDLPTRSKITFSPGEMTTACL
jgi:hypothetical protein